MIRDELIQQSQRGFNMGVILYSKGKKESGKHLMEIIKKAVGDANLEIYASIDELIERLHKPLVDISVVILHAGSRSELMDIIYLEDLLGDLRIILVLPDSEPGALHKAHSLHPRFIATSQSDFKNLDIVVRRMMDLYNKRVER